MRLNGWFVLTACLLYLGVCGAMAVILDNAAMGLFVGAVGGTCLGATGVTILWTSADA